MYINDFVFGKTNALHVLDGAIHVVVSREVVNEDDVVVLVLLLHYRLHDFDVAVVLDVVVAEDSYAEVHLFADILVFVDFVFSAVLFVLELLDAVSFWQIPELLAIDGTEHVLIIKLGNWNCS